MAVAEPKTYSFPSVDMEPCPFCGGEPIEAWNGLPYNCKEQYVSCGDCGLILDGNENGFQEWNRASLHVQHSQAVLWLEEIKLMPEAAWQNKQRLHELLNSWKVAMNEVERLENRLEDVGWS